MPGMISTGQFGHQAQTPNSFNPGQAIGNMAKSFSGVSDFQSAGQAFSKGNIVGGIGHAALGTINAASTAAMAVPVLGEGVKAADIGLNVALKGSKVVKGMDAAKSVESVGKPTGKMTQQLLPGMESGAHNPLPMVDRLPKDLPTMYHGSTTQLPIGAKINPTTYNKGVGYATSDLSTSHQYARASGASGLDHTPGSDIGYIHRVEAPRGTIGQSSSNNFTSNHFEVKEVTHTVNKKTGEVTPIGNNKAFSPMATKPQQPISSSQHNFSDQALPGFENIKAPESKSGI